MKVKKVIIGAILAVIGLPVLLILIAGVTFYLLDETTGAIISSGQEREYLLHVPESYDAATPTPLVISMHGATGWPAMQMDTSRWNRVADEHGFIVAYPSGTGFPKWWSVGPGLDPTADVRFISDLIDTLEATYNIDPARIYADGFSLGAGMAFVLSCTLSDRIAAIGAVAGAQELPWIWCADPRPMPVIAFHGTADPMVPYDGGPSPVPFNPLDYPSVTTWAANWARRNQCAPIPVESEVAPDVTRLEYTGCAADAAMVLYTIEGGGHTWPGGKPLPAWLVGTTSTSIKATSQMWAFFREHPLLRE